MIAKDQVGPGSLKKKEVLVLEIQISLDILIPPQQTYMKHDHLPSALIKLFKGVENRVINILPSTKKLNIRVFPRAVLLLKWDSNVNSPSSNARAVANL
jgi:hypothetical protein